MRFLISTLLIITKPRTTSRGAADWSTCPCPPPAHERRDLEADAPGLGHEDLEPPISAKTLTIAAGEAPREIELAAA
jgi:hypothetical protein